jgi:hypothetical protein
MSEGIIVRKGEPLYKHCTLPFRVSRRASRLLNNNHGHGGLTVSPSTSVYVSVEVEYCLVTFPRGSASCDGGFKTMLLNISCTAGRNLLNMSTGEE